MPSGFVPAFVITEQTGDQRTLTLTGRALPYRPLTFSGDQRHDLTWYPGSSVATLQLLGPEEKPTTIKGMWKDRFIAQASLPISAPSLPTPFTPDVTGPFATVTGPAGPAAVQNVRDLVDLVDDMRRKGQVLTVRWGSYVRQGILATFEHSWHTWNDVEWTMTFNWQAQGENVDAPRVASAASSAADFVQQAQDALDGAVQQAVNAAVDLPLDVINSLEQTVSFAQDQLDSAAQVVSAATSLATQPLDASRSLAAVGSFLSDQYTTVMDQVVAFDDDATLSAAEYTARQNHGLQARSTFRAARAFAIEQAQKFLASVDPDLLATVVARDNQDLRTLAIKYYGSADDWRFLAQHNQLSSSKLTAGQVVVVPRKT